VFYLLKASGNPQTLPTAIYVTTTASVAKHFLCLTVPVLYIIEDIQSQ